MGDVQGKGLEAVETAAVVLAAFREAAPDEPDLSSVNARLERALNRRLSGEEFVTAILAEIREDRTGGSARPAPAPPTSTPARAAPTTSSPTATPPS